LKEELAVMAEFGISPDCIPKEARHCSENTQIMDNIVQVWNGDTVMGIHVYS